MWVVIELRQYIQQIDKFYHLLALAAWHDRLHQTHKKSRPKSLKSNNMEFINTFIMWLDLHHCRIEGLIALLKRFWLMTTTFKQATPIRGWRLRHSTINFHFVEFLHNFVELDYQLVILRIKEWVQWMVERGSFKSNLTMRIWQISSRSWVVRTLFFIMWSGTCLVKDVVWND